MSAAGGDGSLANAPSYAGRKSQMFPQLTAAQIRRLEGYGIRLHKNKDEILSEPGDRHRPMFVVLSGSIEVVQAGMNGEALVVVHTAGSFTGEMSALSSIGSLVRMRVREDAEVVAIPDDHLRTIIQTDSELSELFMRAFIFAACRIDRIAVGRRHIDRLEPFRRYAAICSSS